MYSSHGKNVRTALKVGNKARIQTTYDDATELVEEYDIVKGGLECRRWRTPAALGGTSEWEYEIGDIPQTYGSQASVTITASITNPSFHPRDTKQDWEWHIRNLPYPEETYQVSVSSDSSIQGVGAREKIVLRTTNKKFFKKWDIPALARAGLPLEECRLRKSHDGTNTLVVSYRKPAAVIKVEKEEREAIRKDKGLFFTT